MTRPDRAALEAEIAEIVEKACGNFRADLLRIMGEKQIVEPPDPLLIEAREIVARQTEVAHNEGEPNEWSENCRAGGYDNSDEMVCALAGLRRGMELTVAPRPVVDDAWVESLLDGEPPYTKMRMKYAIERLREHMTGASS